MMATAAEVRAVLAEVGAGTLSPANAGSRLKGMTLPDPSDLTREEILRHETGSITPGSIAEVSMAAARREITREQEDEILDAYRAAQALSR